MDPNSSTIKEFYQTRFSQFGDTSMGVGWDQQKRLDINYIIAMQITPKWENRHILDIGCGYGGGLDSIRKRESTIQYTGIDLVPEMIETAQKRYPNDTFIHGDFMDPSLNLSADYVFACGTFNIAVEEPKRYIHNALTHCLNLCNTGVSVCLLSDLHIHSESDSNRENYNFYNPGDILNFALSIAPFARIHHDYAKESFTLFMYKK